MKKLIFLMAGGVFSAAMIASANPAYISSPTNLSLFNDKPKVAPPPVVRSAFDTRFPNAEIKQWTERKEGQKDSYIAYFKFDGKKLYAYYNANGTWEGTGTPLKWSKDLPANVRKAWKQSDYAAWKIIDLKQIRTPNGTLYQLHLNDSPLLDADHNYAFEDECKLIYNDRGELVRKETR